MNDLTTYTSRHMRMADGRHKNHETDALSVMLQWYEFCLSTTILSCYFFHQSRHIQLLLKNWVKSEYTPRFWNDVDLQMVDTQSAVETTSWWNEIVTGVVEKYDGMPLSFNSRTFETKGPLASQFAVRVNPWSATFNCYSLKNFS